MLSVLLATLALTPADAVSIRAPIYCPETEARYSLLLPRDGGDDVPTNSKIWFTENPALSGGEIELVEAATGSTVAYDLEATTSKRYTLITLTPRLLLKAHTKYELRNQSRAGEITSFTTGADTDDDAPARPTQAQGTASNDGCTYGVLVYGAVANNADVLLLAEEPDAPNALLSFGGGGTVHIPAAQGDTVRYDVVVVDLAGNRSEAETIETLVEVTDNAGGCTCVSARRPHALLALPLLVLFAFSRARCRGSSSRSRRSRSRPTNC